MVPVFMFVQGTRRSRTPLDISRPCKAQTLGNATYAGCLSLTCPFRGSLNQPQSYRLPCQLFSVWEPLPSRHVKLYSANLWGFLGLEAKTPPFLVNLGPQGQR